MTGIKYHILKVILFNLIIFSKTIYGTQYKSAIYYSEWSYPGHMPSDIPLSQITHLYYSFFKISRKHYNIDFTDESVEIHDEISFNTTTLFEDGLNLNILMNNENYPSSTYQAIPWVNSYLKSVSNLENVKDPKSYGIIGQIQQLRKINPRLKILMSIGGENSESDFFHVTKRDHETKLFATEIVANLEAFGFDGIDIDWEFPNKDSSENFIRFLKYVYSILSKKKEKKILSLAVPVDLESLQFFRLAQIDKYIDQYNLMGYDISTPKSDFSGYQSQLYKDKNGSISSYSIDDTINFMNIFVNVSKILLGMPTYGRSFNVESLYKPFSGCAKIPNFIYDNQNECIIDYINLPPADYIEVSNIEVGTAYAYSTIHKGLIVYDTPETVRIKAKYVIEKGLGGGMWWDSKGDPLLNNLSRSLVYNFVDQLGGVLNLSSDTSKFQPTGVLMDGIVTEKINNTNFKSNSIKNYELSYSFLILCITIHIFLPTIIYPSINI